MSSPLSLVWFRRDLRLHDHAALATALAGEGTVQPVFVFDTEILARFRNPADRRLSFIMRTLVNLHRALAQRGGGLLVLHGNPRDVLPKLAAVLKAQAIYSAEDFEPATRARDAAVKAQYNGRFVQVVDHLLKAPYEVLKDDKTPLKVFTPYYKRWRAALHETDYAEYVVKDRDRYADFATVQAAARNAGLDVIDLDQPVEAALTCIGYEYFDDPIWQPAQAEALLRDFVAEKVTDYPTQRDFMGSPGTSRLGPYLRHGLISIRECLRAASDAPNSATWIKELCWREFYAMIMYHWPEVVDHEFQPHYRGTLPWTRDEAVRRVMEEATTGYPIVDAALRELTSTGWMHNRARMIVASFFTKHLLMDWRVGEEYFAQHLMDYELASNNGGWQWSASTGTDAQPYFRVFNPVLQSRKFDPVGSYIRHYLPELAALSDKEVHWPHDSLLCPTGYPKPIVDHQAARARAINVFKEAALKQLL